LQKEKDNFQEFQNRVDNLRNSIKDKNYRIQDLEREFKKLSSENLNKFEENRKLIESDISNLETILYTKDGTFKEFLNSEMLNWEKTLYPILDKSLLSQNIETLKPKILRDEDIFGIDLNLDSLKSIPTKAESEKEINSLTKDLQNLIESFKSESENAKNIQSNSLRDLKFEITIIEKEIQKHLDLKLKVKSKIDNLNLQLSRTLDSVQNSENQAKMEVEKSISDIQSSLLKVSESISKIAMKIQRERIRVQNRKSEAKEYFQSSEKSLQKSFKSQLLELQKVVNIEIAEITKEKEKTSKNDKILQLETQIAQFKILIKKSYTAEIFLKEFDTNQDKLRNYNQVILGLSNIETCSKKSATKFQDRSRKYQKSLEQLANSISQLKQDVEKFEKGEISLNESQISILIGDSLVTDELLYKLVARYTKLNTQYEKDFNKFVPILNGLNKQFSHFTQIDNREFNVENLEMELIFENVELESTLNYFVEFNNSRFETFKNASQNDFYQWITNTIKSKVSVFTDNQDDFIKQTERINRLLKNIDFGVIKKIRIDTELQKSKKSIAFILKTLVDTLSEFKISDDSSSLFFIENSSVNLLNKIGSTLEKLKKELKGENISVFDTVDLSLSYMDNEKVHKGVTQIKNESSTGGGVLLKMAIAISILKLFIPKDVQTPLYLIVDEVARLHSNNQERLRTFANENGFRILFVTPEPNSFNGKNIKYYNFVKTENKKFEAVWLNL